MECFGTTDFDNNSRLITLSVIIISGLHCTTDSHESYGRNVPSIFMVKVDLNNIPLLNVTGGH
jgi:hypothetical protein